MLGGKIAAKAPKHARHHRIIARHALVSHPPGPGMHCKDGHMDGTLAIGHGSVVVIGSDIRGLVITADTRLIVSAIYSIRQLTLAKSRSL